MSSRACQAIVACFPVLASGKLNVLPRLAPVACFIALGQDNVFPALATGYRFSRALHRLHVLELLAPMTRFPALGTDDTFSRLWHRRHVFLPLAAAACFPALGTSSMFSRLCHLLQVFFSHAANFHLLRWGHKPLYKERFDEYRKVCFRLTVVASFASMGTTP